MSLADCALLGPFYAHLYLDAVPGRLLRERAPRVCHWIERMNHPDPTAPGDFLAGDALADTLRPVLALVGRDAVPLLLDTVRDFERWADARPPELEEPPRAVGFHETGFRGARFQRYTSPYTLWMLQRTLDAYRALSDAGAGARRRVARGNGLRGAARVPAAPSDGKAPLQALLREPGRVAVPIPCQRKSGPWSSRRPVASATPIGIASRGSSRSPRSVSRPVKGRNGVRSCHAR